VIPTFEITHAIDARACVAHLFGDIDTAVVPELREQLSASIESGCVNLVLDLTHVTYADSSALGLLVWLDHKLLPCDGRVMLAGANPDVSRILELSGLAHLATSISVTDDVETALEGLEMGQEPAEALWRREICIPADVNRLAGVRDEVSALVAPLGFAESAIFDIKVALGEALANAVRHGAPADDGRVCVGVSAYDDRIVLEIADNGVGFDGVHSGNDDLYAPSGRGIMFMRALMDRVEFEPAAGGGTLVRLVKHHRRGTA
jgi:serine/threonine-protein kinase RsbW